MQHDRDVEKTMEWSNTIPIFKNSIILKQLGIALGIPFGVVLLVLATTAKETIYALYGFALIAALFGGTYLLIQFLWNGKYDAGFVVNSTGIRCYTQKKQASKNRILNALTVIAGLLCAQLSVAGAGLIAQAKTDVTLRWRDIKRVEYHPRQFVITIQGSLANKIALFCTKENYAEVESYVKIRMATLANERGKT